MLQEQFWGTLRLFWRLQPSSKPPDWPLEEPCSTTNKLPITLLKIFSSADKAISTANKEDFGYYTSQSNFCRVMVTDPIPKETSIWFTEGYFLLLPMSVCFNLILSNRRKLRRKKRRGKILWYRLIWRNWRQAFETQLWLIKKYLSSAVHKIQSLLLAIENVPASGWTQQSERKRNNMK